jgi:hypothetical protein
MFLILVKKNYENLEQNRHHHNIVLVIIWLINCSLGVKQLLILFIPLLPEGGGEYTVLPLSVCPSFRPSKIFSVALFSVTIDDSNLIFGHKSLPTIWHTYMKLVTKYQIPVINGCLEKCDEK